MEVFNRIVAHLQSNSISFRHFQHEATPTSEDSARVRGEDLSTGAKAILYKVQDVFYLFVFPANKKMNTKLIKDHFKNKGKRAKKTRFATSEELMALTGLVPGSVPPFGKPILAFDLFVDPSLTQNKTISFNAGSLTNSISISLEDYIKVSSPEIFEFVG